MKNHEKILYWTVHISTTLLPWVANITMDWWVGLAVMIVMFWVYDKVCAPAGSFCMGIPFMVPLTSGLMYLVYGVIKFIVWIIIMWKTPS